MIPLSRRDMEPDRHLKANSILCIGRRSTWSWLGVYAIALPLLLGDLRLAADEPRPLQFTPAEQWFALPNDVTNPEPFTMTSGTDGVTVTFAASTKEVVCQLIGKQWRLDPLGLKPTQISLNVTSSGDGAVTISPLLVDIEGSVLRLPPQRAAGTLTWDIRDGTPLESNSKNSIYSFSPCRLQPPGWSGLSPGNRFDKTYGPGFGGPT